MAGCNAAKVSQTENFPISTQKIVLTTGNWDIIADDIAVQTASALGTKKYIYVATPPEQSDFNSAFHNFLITRMVNKGIYVSNTSNGSIEVQYETQLIKHKSSSERIAYQPGTITALGAGLMVARNIQKWSPEGRAVALMGAIVGADVLASQTLHDSPTKTELVVTTSAIEGGRYLLRKTDIYYIPPEDVSLFEQSGFVNRELTREYRVVGDK
jgi:hypothetical protein